MIRHLHIARSARRAAAVLAFGSLAVLLMPQDGVRPGVAPAAAQATFDDRFPFLDPRFRTRTPRTPTLPRIWSPFGQPTVPAPARPAENQPAQPVVQDYSRAPSARHADPAATTRLLVIGDAFADWLAFGLEQSFEDSPGIAVLRRHRTTSSLIRADQHDWVAALPPMIAADRPTALVMMIGVNERQAFREIVATPKPLPVVSPNTASPVQPPQPTTTTTLHEFRSERWVTAYEQRVAALAGALKATGLPVVWVGVPAVRGPRSVGDMAYLNDLTRAQVEKAGLAFVPVWDAFVDEAGAFVTHGPDAEGQTRRLRTADGVYFTRAGARTLAQYAERALSRLGALGAVPVAVRDPGDSPLPTVVSPDASPLPAERPLAGPVVPLAVALPAADGLLGAPRRGAVRDADAVVDPTLRRVLIDGEAPAPVSGRADDFSWGGAEPPRAALPAQTATRVSQPAVQ
jgi:hypothetical protein